MPKINILSSAYPLVREDIVLGNAMKYKFIDGKKISTKFHGIRAEQMKANIGGALVTQRDSFAFHIAPEIESPKIVKKLLADKVEELRHSGEKVWAFLCGGWAYKQNDEVATKSFNMYTALADKLEELGVPFSMICGKFVHDESDNFRVYNDSVFAWGDAVKNKIDKGAKLSPDEIFDKFSEKYQVVELSPEIDIASSDKF